MGLVICVDRALGRRNAPTVRNIGVGRGRRWHLRCTGVTAQRPYSQKIGVEPGGGVGICVDGRYSVTPLQSENRRGPGEGLAGGGVGICVDGRYSVSAPYSQKIGVGRGRGWPGGGVGICDDGRYSVTPLQSENRGWPGDSKRKSLGRLAGRERAQPPDKINALQFAFQQVGDISQHDAFGFGVLPGIDAQAGDALIVAGLALQMPQQL